MNPCAISDLSNICYRADATINAQATGAMSWAFISAIKANPKQSYVELLNSVRDILETKYTQKPQLSSSHPIGKSVPQLYRVHSLTLLQTLTSCLLCEVEKLRRGLVHSMGRLGQRICSFNDMLYD
jgi:hypothetical protein